MSKKKNPIKEIIKKCKPHQILYVAYINDDGSAMAMSDLCEVLQVIGKTGRTGDTTLIVKFIGETSPKHLSWRDKKIFEIKILGLDEIKDYFAQAFGIEIQESNNVQQMEESHVTTTL